MSSGLQCAQYPALVERQCITTHEEPSPIKGRDEVPGHLPRFNARPPQRNVTADGGVTPSNPPAVEGEGNCDAMQFAQCIGDLTNDGVVELPDRLLRRRRLQ